MAYCPFGNYFFESARCMHPAQVIISLNFSALCMHPTHENRQKRSSFKEWRHSLIKVTGDPARRFLPGAVQHLKMRTQNVMFDTLEQTLYLVLVALEQINDKIVT